MIQNKGLILHLQAPCSVAEALSVSSKPALGQTKGAMSQPSPSSSGLNALCALQGMHRVRRSGGRGELVLGAQMWVQRRALASSECSRFVLSGVAFDLSSVNRRRVAAELFPTSQVDMSQWPARSRWLAVSMPFSFITADLGESLQLL